MRDGIEEAYGATHEVIAKEFGADVGAESLSRALEKYRPPDWVQGAISSYDALFLYEMIRCVKPDRVIEIGTASGVSTAVILRALADCWGEEAFRRGSPRVFSYDISPYCYFDAGRKVGSAAFEMEPQLTSALRLLHGKTAIDAERTFRNAPLQLVFIDADHRHPFPTLDMFTILPALAPGAWILLHDVNLPAFADEYEARTGEKVEWHHHGAKNLFDHWPYQKLKGLGGASNIGAVRIPQEGRVSVDLVRSILRLPWESTAEHVRSAAINNPYAAAALAEENNEPTAKTRPLEEFPGLPVTGEPGRGPKARVCIVCSEFVGPHRNGGMGTAVTSLGVSLARDGHDVTFLYTRGTECLDKSIEHWIAYYAAQNIRLVPLPSPEDIQFKAGSLYAVRSYQVYQWLKKQKFDVVHFPELEGPGYYSMLSKRQGLAFARTTLCVETHSPTRWLHEAQQELLDQPVALEADHMERVSIALADVVAGPSAYLLRWMRQQSWTLPEKTYVQPYVLPQHARRACSGAIGPARPAREFVFFGRLEERKGLRLFCDALDLLEAEHLDEMRVAFLGKSGQIGARSGAAFIAERGKSWTFPWQHHSTFNEAEAIQYLLSGDRIAVMPSRTDNSPNTIYECIAAGVPFIAARSGGIPELISADDVMRSTFPLDARALAATLRLAWLEGLAPVRPAIDFERNDGVWRRWHEELAAAKVTAAAESGSVPAEPLVSVCIAHCAGLPALRTMLESVQAQTYRNIEILIAAPPDSELSLLPLNGVRFVSAEGVTPSQLFNAAGRQASGDYLFFVDSGSVLRPETIETSVAVARKTGSEITTSAIDCYLTPTGHPCSPRPAFRFLPLGASATVGLLRNSFGAPNPLVRRGRFLSLGGFVEEAGVVGAQWAFYADAVLAGASVEVIPESLQSRRISGSDELDAPLGYRENGARIRPFLDALPDSLRDLIPLLQGQLVRSARIERAATLVQQNATAQLESDPMTLARAAMIMIHLQSIPTAIPLLEAACRMFEASGDADSSRKIKANLERLRKKSAPHGNGSVPKVASKKRSSATADPPMATVVIPCFKQAEFLPEAVQSVISQSFADWELIIVNDGSPDATSQVASDLIAKNPHRRIRLIEKPNGGLGSARNRGMAEAKGKYLLPLDADDRIHPEFLERTVRILESHKEVGFVYSHIQHFGDRTDVWELPEFDANTIATTDNTVCACALFRQEAYAQVGGYNEKMRPQGYEDWDFWVGCIEKGWKGYRIPEPLFFYRIRQSSMLSQSNRERLFLFATIVLNHPVLYDEASRTRAREIIAGRTARKSEEHPAGGASDLSITYLITSLLGITGGNQTLLRQANALIDRGHHVTIVSRTGPPAWFPLKAKVVQVPGKGPMAPHVPPSDVVIATYFMNAAELPAIEAPVKIYFAQGDQFIFDDRCRSKKPDIKKLHAMLKELSRASYLLPGVRFVANSGALASEVQRRYGRAADALLPVCVDVELFTPLEKSAPKAPARILVVGPDEEGTEIEPLEFKGLRDVRSALDILRDAGEEFTVIRISNSERAVFRDFPCEFHIAPDDSAKRNLFGSADILLYGSHYDSCPRIPLEAMAAGVAVVCTETAGALEYCVDGENAILVPVRSPRKMADAARRLLHDRNLLARISRGGITTARNFPKEREWDELERLLYTYTGRGTSTSKADPRQHPATGESVRVMLQRAEQLLKEGNIPAALEAAMQAEKEAATSSPAGSSELVCGLKNFLGYCQLSLGNLESAKAEFSESLRLNPNSSRACTGLGDVFRKAGLNEHARTMYEWALKNDPSNRVAAQGLASVPADQGADADSNPMDVEPSAAQGAEDITSVQTDSAFARTIRSLIARIRPKRIVETGTFQGTGTTAVIADSLRELGLRDTRFYSIEVNPGLHQLARRNLEKAGLLSYVRLMNGLSVPRRLLPDREDIERRTVLETESQGLYVDHPLERRVDNYFQETDFPDVAEDLLARVLDIFDCRPDFVLLDSGGHMGNIEFNYLIEQLKGSCYLMLDDIFHVKHHRSFTQLSADPRFEVLEAVKEKAGFCLAKFTPRPQASDAPGRAKGELQTRLAMAGELFSKKRFAESIGVLEGAEEMIAGIPGPARDEATAGVETIRGMNLLGLSDLEGAKASFEHALKIQPGSTHACAGLGEVLYLAGMDKQAKVMFEHAVALGASNTFASAGLAKTNMALGLAADHNTLREGEGEAL